VRLANLRSGQLDFIERLAPSDVPNLKSDSRFKIANRRDRLPGHHINVGKSDSPKKTHWAKTLASERRSSCRSTAIRSSRCDGGRGAGGQPVGGTDQPLLRQERPRFPSATSSGEQLLKEAGVPKPSFTLMTPTTSDAQRIAQVVQAMAKDAGFDVKIQSNRVRSLFTQSRGQRAVRGVRARVERARRSRRQPAHHARLQGPTNYAGYCKEESEADRPVRAPRSSGAARRRVRQDRASRGEGPPDHLPSTTRNWLWAHSAKLTGLHTVPDGLVRVQGLKMN